MHWLLVGGGLPLLAVVLVRVAQEVPSRGAPAAATDDDEGLTCFISICSLLMADCWMESSLPPFSAEEGEVGYLLSWRCISAR